MKTPDDDRSPGSMPFLQVISNGQRMLPTFVRSEPQMCLISADRDFRRVCKMIAEFRLSGELNIIPPENTRRRGAGKKD